MEAVRISPLYQGKEIKPPWLRLPVGLRDWAPEELAALRAVEGRLRRSFEAWGYQEVATPALEYLDTWSRGMGSRRPASLFVVVDRTGELLALRPEMTVPVARFVATRWRGGVARLYYVGSVFRGDPGRGNSREFPQAGAERVGDGGPDADAEVVALAVEALQQAGVRAVRVGLGHAGFLRALLDAAGLGDGGPVAQEALYRRDFVTLSSLLDTAPADVRRVVLDLPSLRGAEALGRARALGVGREALEELEAVVEALRPYGVDGAVEVDLGIIRDFDYYTGLVLEAYAAGSGAPLLGGGRYDQLLERFGSPQPAVGFAVHVERVLAACGQAAAPAPALQVAYDAPSRHRALAWAQRARAAGLRVAAGPGEGEGPGPRVSFRGQEVWWVEPDGSRRPITAADLDALLEGRTP
ncbi:MAG: ATP phosphoribosyltransferase regulatory subunit [Armatimonadota bacterium]|nr:ATP phosphoribosyltransferase regulatory subunit [Armatimonadota bacterium]MDW8155354.1 ATP phosphoribosyltransferase regulatory subunit [Armatimonadota bacterium]